jgi:acyl-CoA synthetase (AMP-forming)/AMP-acid ligase II
VSKQVKNIQLEAATFVDILRWRALYQPDELAYSYLDDGEVEEDHLTYKELDTRAQVIAASLQALGAASQRVLLLLPPGLDYISAFFGCLYAGAIAVPACPPRRNEKLHRLNAIARDSLISFGIATSTILTRFESLSMEEQILGIGKWLAVDQLERVCRSLWKEPSIGKNSVAFIQYTSGSSTEPKGVMVSHGNLLANSAIIHERFGHTSGSRGVIWLPPYHDMGLIGGVMQPLYGGFPVTLMAPVTFLLRPFRWLQAISRTRATTSGGPNFAYDLCVRKITPEQRRSLDLSSWEVAFNGSEPIRHGTLERFAATFEQCGFRRDAFYPCYGLAEATLFVSGGTKSSIIICKVKQDALERHRVEPADEERDSASLVACGEPASSFGVAIVDPERLTRCAPDEIGEIWLSGPSIALGYWNRLEETDQKFRAYTADTREGPFFRTGDLGFFFNDQLVIAGRLKDLIILAGRNHYPQDIELTVEAVHSALRSGGSAAFSISQGGEEQLVIFAEVAQQRALSKTVKGSVFDAGEVLRAIRQAIAEHHGVCAHHVLLLKPGSIPRTPSGKIQRHLCRSRFLQGNIEAMASL